MTVPDYGIIPYASRTGTKAHLAAFRKLGWRLLVSAKGRVRNEGMPYALDNGAWHSYQQGLEFDVTAFEKALAWSTTTSIPPDWVVLPDIVGGARDSLRLSEQWIHRVLRCTPRALIPVQDGMEPKDVESILCGELGLFLGGTTAWKLQSAPTWARLARRKQCYFHVARVNSVRRIDYCRQIGATSFDGSGPSRFLLCLERLQRGLNQGYLPLQEGPVES